MAAHQLVLLLIFGALYLRLASKASHNVRMSSPVSRLAFWTAVVCLPISGSARISDAALPGWFLAATTGVFLAAVLVLIVSASKDVKTMSARMAARAAELGFSHEPGETGARLPSATALPAELAGLKPLALFRNAGGLFGAGYRLIDILKGSAGGGSVWLFAYCPVSKWDMPVTVAAIKRAEGRWPPFALRPRGLWDGLVGRGGLSFEGDPAFASSYALEAEDEGATREVFRAAVLESLRAAQGWSIEANGEWWIAFKRDELVDPENLRAFVDDVSRLYAAFRKD